MPTPVHTCTVRFTHKGYTITEFPFSGAEIQQCKAKAIKHAEKLSKRAMCDSNSDGTVSVVTSRHQHPPEWSSRNLPNYDDPYKPWRD